MKKIIYSLAVLCLSATAMAASNIIVVGPVGPVFNDPTSPCKPIRIVCLAAGFQLNDHANHNSLISDCMMPIAQNQPVTNATTGTTVVAPSGTDISACFTHIHNGPRPLGGIGAKSRTNPETGVVGNSAS